MNPKIFAAFWLLLPCHSYGGGIPHSEESVGMIASEFAELVDLLHQPSESGLPTTEQLVRTLDGVEAGPSNHLIWKGREFDYQATEGAEFTIKVYGVERTYSIFSIFGCTNWIEYSSSKRPQTHKVIHEVGGWSFVEACRP